MSGQSAQLDPVDGGIRRQIGKFDLPAHDLHLVPSRSQPAHQAGGILLRSAKAIADGLDVDGDFQVGTCVY